MPSAQTTEQNVEYSVGCVNFSLKSYLFVHAKQIPRPIRPQCRHTVNRPPLQEIITV